MPVYKAISYDDEEREGFAGGGSRRGTRRGSFGRGRGTAQRSRRSARSRSRRSSRRSGPRSRGVTRTKRARARGVSSKAVKQRIADTQNTLGTKYTGNLQKAIADANKRHRDRSLANRKNIAAEAAIQATEAKQVSPTAESVASKVASMDAERKSLSGLNKQRTPEQLNKLATLNKAIGINPTTGMGIMNSLKYNVTNPEFKRDVKQAGQFFGSLPTPMNILRRIGTGLLTDFGGIKDAVTGAQKSQRQPGLFASGQDSRGLFGGIGQGIGNFFGGLDIGPSGVENERRGGERRALNREGIYGGIDPLSSSAVARDASPLTTPAADPVNPTTGAIDYSSAMATSPALSNQMLSSPATLPTMAAQGTPYRLRDYYAGVLGQDPSIYQTAANGGRIGKMNGGMMIMGDNGVVNNGIGGILSKYKEIRSEL